MSDSQEEISTTPVPGVPNASLAILSSTSSPLVASLQALPLFAKPLTAWALIGLAGKLLLPRLWESIHIGVDFLKSGCACAWAPWIPSMIYATLVALCINPKTIRDAGGVVGAATNLVAAIRGAKKG